MDPVDQTATIAHHFGDLINPRRREPKFSLRSHILAALEGYPIVWNEPREHRLIQNAF